MSGVQLVAPQSDIGKLTIVELAQAIETSGAIATRATMALRSIAIASETQRAAPEYSISVLDSPSKGRFVVPLFVPDQQVELRSTFGTRVL